MEDQKVMQLAETLKSHGLAASMYEAIEKAKSILNINLMKSGEQQKNNEAKNDDWDITKENATLNDLMREVGVTPEQVEAQERGKLESIREEVSNIRNDIEGAEKNPGKAEQIKEEIAKVKAEVDKVTGNDAENQEPKNAEEYGGFKEGGKNQPV